MEFLFALLVFIFGTIIGSFLNVVVLRYGTGMSVQGRSFCFSCGKKLTWKELIPVVSYLTQLGKCRGCGSKISFQYPAVEILTGAVFVLTVYSTIGFTTYENLIVAPMLFLDIAFYAIVWSILIAILVYDMRHKIIPDGLVYTFIGISFIKLFVTLTPVISFGLPSLTHFLAGPILFLPFFLLWFLSRGTWMGLGDGKLALGIGWLLGLNFGISAVIYAFWIGAAVSVVLYILGKMKQIRTTIGLKTELPFAPFLILGLFIVYLTQVDVITLVASIQERLIGM